MLCKKYLIYVTGQFIPMATVVLPSNYSEFKSRWFKLAIYLQRYCYYFAAHKLLLPVSCNKLCEFYVRDGRTFHCNWWLFNNDLRLTQLWVFPSPSSWLRRRERRLPNGIVFQRRIVSSIRTLWIMADDDTENSPDIPGSAKRLKFEYRSTTSKRI